MGGIPRVVPLTVMVLGMLLAGCSQEDDPGADLLGADRPTFTSVAALNRDADAAVVGTVDGVIGTELDNGGNPESDSAGGGTPMTLLRFSVERTIRGQAPATITLAWPDSAGTEDLVSELRTGERVVLWLDHLTAEQAPGLDLVNDVWVPLGGDDGVMDVKGQAVRARSSNLVSLDNEPATSPLETTLAALEQAP
jgi:hypothetical protein